LRPSPQRSFQKEKNDMSSDGFHVHGPHDHAVEHGAQAGDTLASRVAVMTAILSTVGAVFSYQGGATQNEAMIFKNEAVLKKTEASDQWGYYQAKSNKQNLAELAAAIAPPDRKTFYEGEVERYKAEKRDIQAKAQKLDEDARHFNEQSEHALHPHHRLAQAITMVQIAISLAAITVLTRKKWLFWGSGISAGAGAALWLLAMAGH
jgi:hypothetical protein